MKLVKVARVGGKLREVCLPDCATISQALAAAGMSKSSNEDAWINHHVVDISSQIGNGEIVILEPRSVSPAVRAFIDKMWENDFIEACDYEDDYGNYDYNECYSDHKTEIDELIKIAREG